MHLMMAKLKLRGKTLNVKNLHVYSENEEWLKTIQDEYRMIGFDTRLKTKNELIVFAKPRGSRSRRQRNQDNKRKQRS